MPADTPDPRTLTGDNRILWGVIANAGRLLPRAPRWHHVKEATSLGSTSSAELCRRFGFDPDEEVGRAPTLTCDGCGDPATTEDDHGTPLCDDCYDACKEERVRVPRG